MPHKNHSFFFFFFSNVFSSLDMFLVWQIDCYFSAKSCPTLCKPLDCSPQSSSVHFPGKNIRVGCHFLLQGIFLTWGSNRWLLHWCAGFFHWVTREAPIQFSMIDAQQYLLNEWINNWKQRSNSWILLISDDPALAGVAMKMCFTNKCKVL